MKNADMPAMPIVDADATPMSHQELSDWRDNSCLGLTKREIMAMHMMQGVISRGSSALSSEGIARYAVVMADALLAELEKQQ
ncbi:MAG: hypothetical protein ACRCXB_13790 [Aeromonadaceae bacterium]